MEQIVVPLILVGGIILAALITRWINWFTWGENRQRAEERRKVSVQGDQDSPGPATGSNDGKGHEES